MTIWVDAQLSPALAAWITWKFSVAAEHVQELGKVEASDPEIFQTARLAGAVVLTKDRDFVDLVRRLGPPPQIIWLTAGNPSNAEMQRILSQTLAKALELIEAGEPVVEIKLPVLR